MWICNACSVFYTLCCMNLGNIIAYSSCFLKQCLSGKSAQNKWQKCARQLKGQKAKFIDNKRICYDFERKACSLGKPNWKYSFFLSSAIQYSIFFNLWCIWLNLVTILPAPFKNWLVRIGIFVWFIRNVRMSRVSRKISMLWKFYFYSKYDFVFNGMVQKSTFQTRCTKFPQSTKWWKMHQIACHCGKKYSGKMISI